jgi:hypothetical protein
LTSSRISPGRITSFAKFGNLDTAVGDALAYVVAQLRIQRSLRREHLVERAAGDRFADRELPQAVQPSIHIGHGRDHALGVDDPAESRQGHTQRDAIPGQHFLRGDLDRLRPQIEALDLDLAAGDPEGVPAGRKPLHQPALDIEHARREAVGWAKAR